MRFTKKMIMVPQVEYQTLLNMLKGENPIATEKAEVETKISKVLRDRKLNEQVKGKKYDLLVKKRQQLKNELKREAEKPQKVLLDTDQLKSIEASIANPRYLGVAVEGPSKTPPRKRRKITTPEVAVERHSSASDIPEGYKTADEDPPYIIHPNYYKNVQKILKQNKQKIGINDKNELSGIPDSNISEILDYLTGRSKIAPGGTEALVSRIRDEKWFKDALDWAKWHQQRGEGRRKKHKKTPFKPLLWARL